MVEDLRAALRRARASVGEAVGATVAAVPALEPAFVSLGIAVSRWHLPGTLYWDSHEALARRLRASGRRFREFDVFGIPITLDITDMSASLRYFHRQPYEPDLTAFIAAFVRPGSVFVDIGANAGLFSVLAARCASPGGRVLSFEPHPEARARLRDLVEVNGLTDVVTTSPHAVSDVSGHSVRLFVTGASELSTIDPSAAPLGGLHRYDHSIEVPVTTLDDWLEAAGPPWSTGRLDLIKIDVEGEEASVIRGMARTLARLPAATIACETSPDSEADRLLRSAGFSVRPLEQLAGRVCNLLYTRGELLESVSSPSRGST